LALIARDAGISDLHAHTLPDNRRALRVLDKIGFPRTVARKRNMMHVPPLPMPWYFPFQALSGGSQTSNLMSESADGLSTPSTRQNGLFTDTGVGGSCPVTLKGGATLVAADIVASPKFLPAKPWQSAAAALPAPKARAPLTIAVQAAARLGTTFDMFRS
jgi:hypothetical protein